MSSYARSETFAGAPAAGSAAGAALGVAAGALALVLVSALAVALSESAVRSPQLALAAGLAALAIVALALFRYDAAVALGFLLLAIVRTEPAPPDLVFAAIAVVALVTGRLRLRAVPRSVGALLAALVAINLLSAIEAVDTGKAARFLMITLYLVVFGLWLAGYLDSRRRARQVVGAYLAAAVGSALLGTLSLFASFPASAELSAEGYRAKGLFEDPNVFGPFLVPAAVILLEERLRPRLFARRPLLTSLGLVVVTAGVLFSYSRAAWLNLVVAVAIVALLSLRGRGGARRALRLAAATIMAAGVALAVVQATGSVDFLEQRAHYQTYDGDRFGAQQAGVELALAHPLGVGPGQFDVLVPVSSHSLYVRVLAEQGLLGLALTLALVAATLLLAARDAWLARDVHGISSVALLAIWCGILVNSAVVDTLHWRHLWVWAAAIWAASTSRRTDKLRLANGWVLRRPARTP